MEEHKLNKIRNFAIIAHIDHGKSTLADRIMELTNTVLKRDMKEQLLDSMDLERERGITIKLNAVKINYKSQSGEDYVFNLIDTPGHVDFTYEVSRSLAACEGAILVVDAVSGIQAQTIANLYLALDNNLDIIPVINKIDLPNSDIERVSNEIENIIGIPKEKIIMASARNGIGVIDILERIITDIKPPQGDKDKPLKALIFDSYYDSYRGVIPMIRVRDGEIKTGDKIKMFSSDATFTVDEVGFYNPKLTSCGKLLPGEVGYLVASIKEIDKVRVGDTITNKENPAKEPLPGYRKLNPVVFCGLYPIDNDEYDKLKDALEKLKLNDAALVYEPETSQALGFGFRTGFLGLLHMDVIKERIFREFGIAIIATAPSVIYKLYLTNGQMKEITNPCEMPEQQFIAKIEEPYVKANIITPENYVGDIMKICQEKRGKFITMNYLDKTRVEVYYLLPLAEVVYDFFDRLKSSTKGYASFDYEIDNYYKSDLIKINILLNAHVIDALAIISHRDFAFKRGKQITEKMKDLIPRQQFEVPVQAAIGNKIIARSTIKALRKDVLAKCYGGDVSRKKKLLEKQKEGKKKMKKIGSVDVPQEAFMAVLKTGDD